jgi:parvulin-like peptidyl-prolyl isomerase
VDRIGTRITVGLLSSIAVLSGILAAGAAHAADGAPVAAAAPQAKGERTAPATPPVDPVIARVGDQTITMRHLNAAYGDAARKKFYHAEPPEAEVAALRRQIADKLVDDLLIFQEAKRRGVTPDAEAVAKTIAGYDAQYGSSEQWQKNRERLLPGLKGFLEQQTQVARFRQQVLDNVPAPDEKAERAYYQAHPEKFTEPEKLHLHTIMLAVDPSSKKEIWEKARKECRDLAQRIRDGADFAELARARSADSSAGDGGDRGWLHTGVLPPKVQEAADKLKLGEISEPVTVLEGVVILRVDERQAPQPRSFEDVRKRLDELLAQEQRDEAWKVFVADLRKATPPQIDAAVYPPPAPNAAADSQAAR